MAPHAPSTFLEAVLASPDDDAPRLAYAAWLRERGDPRGAFIRVQCALAGAEGRDPARRAALEAEEQDLLDRDRRRALWLAEIGLTDNGVNAFRRGFVERVGLSLDELLARHEALARATPVRSLRVWEIGARLDALLDLPLLRQLRELSLRGAGCGADAIRALSSCEALAGLGALDLAGNRFGVQGTEAFAASPVWSSVTRLDLTRCSLGPAALKELARSQPLARLDELILSDNDIRSVKVLLSKPSPLRFTRLQAAECRLDDKAAQAIASSPAAARLRFLDLGGNRIRDEGAAALATSPHLGQLDELRLAGNPIGPEAMAELRARFGERLSG